MSEHDKQGLSRRGFLRGAGVTAAGTLLESAHALTKDVSSAMRSANTVGPDATQVTLQVNGAPHTLSVEPRTTLAAALRDNLGLTGTKVVCDRGSCSACTIWLDKVPMLACMTLAVDVGARHVTTIEGLEIDGQLHPLQAAFIRHDAMQCGFCTPGMVMSCVSLLERNHNPTLDDVKHAVSGNLCRCGTYPKVFAATLEAAGQQNRLTQIVSRRGEEGF